MIPLFSNKGRPSFKCCHSISTIPSSFKVKQVPGAFSRGNMVRVMVYEIGPAHPYVCMYVANMFSENWFIHFR